MSKLWDDNDLGLPPKDAERIGLRWLVAAAIATILLWQIPLGDYILYPFSILATWFHEMGHGITALILGGNFHQLQIFPNGSGFAMHSGVRFLGPIGQALVAMGGPMGPPLAGAAFILASRHRRSARWSLIFLGLFLLISTLIWVRSLFGFIAIPALGAAILWVGMSASLWLQCFGIQFLGLQACISTYHQLDYLFMGQAVIGGRLVISDSAQIAQNLLLPYWFWGGLMAIASALLLYWSLRLAYAD